MHPAAQSTRPAPRGSTARARPPAVAGGLPPSGEPWRELLDEGPTYQPRQGRDSVLWAVVSEHLDELVELAADQYRRPLPRYVEQALRAYLSCGDFERGFVRCHCDECGYDILVPYSCGTRSTCPSCANRRMDNTAAFLVDRVLPNVPIRQYVLSLPWELRPLTLAKPAVVTALGRIFAQSMFETYRERAERAGIGDARCGTVTSLHRAGDSLNANPHWHAQTPDGVWFRDTGHGKTPSGATPPLRFEPAPAPTPPELERLVTRIRDRSIRWLDRHGYLDRRPYEERSNEPGDPTALAGCAGIAMAGGTVGFLDDAGTLLSDAGLASPSCTRSPSPFTATCDGFNLNAGVLIEAGDDEGRERLARYCLRPPFALSRLTQLDDGRLAYRTRYPLRGGATHRIMEPLELMARLAALVAPPRHPLVRYFGVLSSHAEWRAEIVPRPPPTKPPNKGKRCPAPDATSSDDDQDSGQDTDTTSDPSAATVAAAAAEPETAATPACRVVADDLRQANTAAHLDELTIRPATAAECRTQLALLEPFNVLTTPHLERLLDGKLLAPGPRLSWALLLQRTYAIDLGTCPRCGGRMKPIAQIHDPEVIARILNHLDRRLTSPRASPRAPPVH